MKEPVKDSKKSFIESQATTPIAYDGKAQENIIKPFITTSMKHYAE